MADKGQNVELSYGQAERPVPVSAVFSHTAAAILFVFSLPWFVGAIYVFAQLFADDTPTRDRPYVIFVGTIVLLVGLAALFPAASIVWRLAQRKRTY